MSGNDWRFQVRQASSGGSSKNLPEPTACVGKSGPRWAFRAASCLLAAMAGCTTWLSGSSSLPVRNVIVRDQLVIYSNSSLPPRHRLLDSLAAERGQLLHELGLPSSDEPIHVYLFDSESRFQAFMKRNYAKFPSRRAFFVQSDMRLAVYAFWGDRVAEDLRHEVAHGYLHSVVPQIPLWLDEGLAEFAEVPHGRGGYNEPHVRLLLNQLVAGTWRPDLSRLEQLPGAEAMTQVDYAEAWAWAHWMLTSNAELKALLQGYLHGLRQDDPRAPLSLELRQFVTDAERQLVEHLYDVAPRPEAVAG